MSTPKYEFSNKNYNKLVALAKELFACDHAGADKKVKALWNKARKGEVDLVTIETDWRTC